MQELSAAPEEYPSDAVMEMFIGTWGAIALITEALAGSRHLELEEIVGILADAEAYARDKGNRHIALRAVRTRIEAVIGPGDGDPGDEHPAEDGGEKHPEAEEPSSPLLWEEREKRRIGGG